MACADVKIRKCIPIVSSWLADHMQNVNIHGVKTNVCPISVATDTQLGILAKTPYDLRNHEGYEQLYQDGDVTRYVFRDLMAWKQLPTLISLNVAGIKPFSNTLWTIRGITPPNLIRGDNLHNILLGMKKHLMEWIEGFLKQYNGLGVLDKVWENIPPYPGYYPPHKQYGQITVWSGTEMRGFTPVILACFTVALGQTAGAHKLSAAAQRDSKIAVRCVRAITDFCHMAQYRSYTQQTIGSMNEYLQ